MQRLVAIELKLGDFKPADSGQMELYLRWLDRNERQPSEQRRPASSCALARSARRSSTSISTRAGSTSPST
jgi:hypothetical protein